MSAHPATFQFATFGSGPLAGKQSLRHGITRRMPAMSGGGDVSFTTGGETAEVRATRAAWTAAVRIEPERIVTSRLVHGNAVLEAREADAGRGVLNRELHLPIADGLISAHPDLGLMMTFADCTPLLFFDPRTPAVGVAHAGWRGTVADIAGATVRAMTRAFGTRASDLVVGIGPAIGACCYTVRHDVLDAWSLLSDGTDAAVHAQDSEDQWRFDLPRANQWLLERAGVDPRHIENSGVCTSCQVDEYFSHRAERGRAGRFAAIVGLAAARRAARDL